ncbi:hypothetical protein DFQ27_005657 [Actinomortierella ambigua]|uniref:Serine protease n=1 Tax=Actinomortierella ambigua TaxID=1343610 RepID=A0A9P6PY80_9FUNG|nr:hypothetical protein DFQ27_005657 [Actinomortierella ambigua]
MKLTGLILVACIAIANAAPLISKPTGDVIPDSYIVVLKESNTAENFRGKFNAIARRQNGRGRPAVWDRAFKNALNGFSGSFNKAVLDELLASDEVEFVEQDRIVTISASQPSPPSWGLSRVSSRNLAPGAPYVYQNAAGAGVTAYVIDTGISVSHTDFGGRATSGANFITGSPNTDENGHGTHVAGTIGGTRFGVAKRVNLVGVKVLNRQGSGSFSGIIGGMDWVTQRANSRSVVNMSLGGGKSAAVDAAVNRMVNKGISLFVAAGNDANADACNGSPSGATSAFTVAASDSYDRLASFSSWGRCCDIIAPGVGITSAWIGGNSATRSISGTSMATPHVAGVAALLISAENLNGASAVYNRILSLSTPNKVSGNLRGTPNRLLFNGAQ